jgi:hypothetical protein
MADAEMPIEVRSLAGTLRRWRSQIIAWHTARVSNGPTEALIIWSAGVRFYDVAEDACERVVDAFSGAVSSGSTMSMSG